MWAHERGGGAVLEVAPVAVVGPAPPLYQRTVEGGLGFRHTCPSKRRASPREGLWLPSGGPMAEPMVYEEGIVDDNARVGDRDRARDFGHRQKFSLQRRPTGPNVNVPVIGRKEST
jgi:hypothetical protein